MIAKQHLVSPARGRMVGMQPQPDNLVSGLANDPTGFMSIHVANCAGSSFFYGLCHSCMSPQSCRRARSPNTSPDVKLEEDALRLFKKIQDFELPEEGSAE